MLPEVPCIPGLVGCDDGGFQNAGSENTGSTSSFRFSSASNGSIFGTTNTSSLNSSSNNSLRFSSSSSVGANLSARFGISTKRIARYTVSTVNRGQQAASGYVFSHGPLPTGAMFDPVRSSKNCIQAGSFVQCTLDLNVGESKSPEIVYTVQDSFSCAIARALQSVKKVSGTGADDVGTSVNCVISHETSSVFSSSENSSSIATSAYTGFSGSGSALNQLGSVSSTNNGFPTVVAQKDDFGKGKGKGYKPSPQPRAGAASDFFLAHITQDSLLTPVRRERNNNNFSWILWSAFLLAFLCTAIGIVIYRSRKRLT